MNDGWFVVSMCLSSMNDWKIYENGGLSAGCELKLFGRGGDSFFHGGCCVWCVVAFILCTTLVTLVTSGEMLTNDLSLFRNLGLQYET